MILYVWPTYSSRWGRKQLRPHKWDRTIYVYICMYIYIYISIELQLAVRWRILVEPHILPSCVSSFVLCQVRSAMPQFRELRQSEAIEAKMKGAAYARYPSTVARVVNMAWSSRIHTPVYIFSKIYTTLSRKVRTVWIQQRHTNGPKYFGPERYIRKRVG